MENFLSCSYCFSKVIGVLRELYSTNLQLQSLSFIDIVVSDTQPQNVYLDSTSQTPHNQNTLAETPGISTTVLAPHAVSPLILM